MDGYILICLLCVGFIVLRHWGSRAFLKRLPPGPKGLPLVGNLFQFPRKKAWEAFAKWGEEHGDVVYANFAGQPTLLLNSRKACIDLLDKRSAVYSDRPRLVMLIELCGVDWNFGLLPHSPRWRKHRRLFYQYFNENVARDYTPLQEQCAHAFLLRLVQSPEDFMTHTRLVFADMILRIVYGIQPQDYHDPYVRLMEEALHLTAEATIPGRFLVDLIPILKYIPSWFPGAGFKRLAAKWRITLDDSKDLPARHAESEITNQTTKSNVYTKMLTQTRGEKDCQSPSNEDREDAAAVAALAYLAGGDTTLSSAQALFLALARHPEVQRAAQAEIDAVVGKNRLPTFDDLEHLPYVAAITKEILRWHVVIPLGMPHCLTENDEYQGYFIPKGTVVIPNSWKILHDPDIYPDPFEFKPSRWLIDTPDGMRLNNAIPDPDIACFGYGRRICPGQHFARNALFIIASNVLACFNISPVDHLKSPDEVRDEFTDGFLIYPKPFEASITPRSDAVKQVIEDVNM